MNIFRSIDDVIIEEPLAVALGTFDGIHLGHRLILERTVKEARDTGLKSCCFTFSDIPRAVLNKQKGSHKIIKLSSDEEKLEKLEEIGFDYVVIIPFDKHIMDVSAENFVSDILVRRLNAKTVCCGFNYTYGKKASGDVDTLKRDGCEYGLKVIVQDAVYADGEVISSTSIRHLLETGDAETIRKMLG